MLDRHELGIRLSRVPIFLNDLQRDLKAQGFSIPVAFQDYLVAQTSSDGEKARRDHLEFLRELFGAFGSTSALFPLNSERPQLPYASEALEARRLEVQRDLPPQSQVQDLPRSSWELNPYMRMHWQLVQSAGADYQRFTSLLSDTRHDRHHWKAVEAMNLGGLGAAKTTADVLRSIRECVEHSTRRETVLAQGKEAVVVKRRVCDAYALVLVLDEISTGKGGTQCRPFIRLVQSDEEELAGPFSYRFTLQMPMAELVPGFYFYQRMSSGEELAVGVAFYVALHRLLTPAFEVAFD